MGKLRCNICKELAHIMIEKKSYCLECAPKPDVPEVTVAKEIVKEKLHTGITLKKIGNVEIERIEKRKAWWKKHRQ